LRNDAGRAIEWALAGKALDQVQSLIQYLQKLNQKVK